MAAVRGPPAVIIMHSGTGAALTGTGGKDAGGGRMAAANKGRQPGGGRHHHATYLGYLKDDSPWPR